MLDLLKNSLNVKVLGEEQLSKISGGKGSCAAQGFDPVSGESYCTTGLSLQEAKDWAKDNGGGHWCCDSCSTASWHVNCIDAN